MSKVEQQRPAHHIINGKENTLNWLKQQNSLVRMFSSNQEKHTKYKISPKSKHSPLKNNSSVGHPLIWQPK